MDLVVYNDVSTEGIGFDADDNEVVLISATGERRVTRAPKGAIAAAIIDAAEEAHRDQRCRILSRPGPGPSPRRRRSRRSGPTSRHVIHAPADTLELCVLCLVSEGHLIIEDFPGVGKTMLAKALARSLERVVLASPVHARPAAVATSPASTSSTSASNEFEFSAGPVFANLLLADEINRASPKTQSALLEAMQEQQVTVDGVTLRAGAAVHGDGDAEPDRVRGHVSAARGAARPLHDAPVSRLSAARRGGADADRADHRSAARRPRSGRGHAKCWRRWRLRAIFVEESLSRYVVALLRHTRATSSSPSGRARAPASRSSRVAKALALAVAAITSCPRMSRRSRAVLAHRLIVAPEARGAGRGRRRRFRERSTKRRYRSDAPRKSTRPRRRRARCGDRVRITSARRRRARAPRRGARRACLVGARGWAGRRAGVDRTRSCHRG